MLVALDRDGNRVFAEEAEKTIDYYCPTCSKRVILKRGSINISHFAHQSNECEDKWHYDMSEWHYSMQGRFDKSYREVVVKHKGVIHRADILLGNKIIEFQHSPIAQDEIIERNYFYKAAGYKVAWVFDLQEQYDLGAIQSVDRSDSSIMYRWSNPKRVLQCFPKPKEWYKDLTLFFYWIDEEGYEWFNRVIWSTNDDEIPNFKRFIVSEYSDNFEIGECERLVVEQFFETKADLLNKHLSKIKASYNIKQCGVKGYPQKNYICPRTGKFGLKRSGESACVYCRYCAAIKLQLKGFSSYCCYPVQVNEINELHPGYECSGIPQF